MNTNNKLNIGVITARADETKQKQILNGIMSQAQLLNINIMVISNLYCPYDVVHNFQSENLIYNLISSNCLDGIILIAESILNETLQQIIIEKIKLRKDIPIAVIDGNIDGFTCFNDTDELDFQTITDHLIDTHKFNNINILTGNKEYNISHIRVEGYKKSL